MSSMLADNATYATKLRTTYGRTILKAMVYSLHQYHRKTGFNP
jgi:hypothetical protein